MKKFMYSVLAAATMLFATTSCSSEEEIVGGSQNGDTQQVTFTVQMPGEDATSRAIADGVSVGKGNMADKLIWALYEKGKDKCLDSGVGTTNTKETDETGNAKHTFTATINMVKGLTYNVVFLAYNNGNPAFKLNQNPETTDLTKLTLKDNLSANQESYDAFVKCQEHTVKDGDAVTEVTLQRPFAQINAATSNEDLARSITLGARVVKSQLAIEKVPTQINLLNGEVSEYETVTYTKDDILYKYENGVVTENNELLSIQDGAETNTYNYLNMAYVLAGEGATTESTHYATFTFYRDETITPDLVRTLEIINLPIKRNYRTNIIGNLLTEDENFKIVIDDKFEQPDITPTYVSSWDEFTAALADDSKYIKLSKDITYNDSYTLKKDVTIDLNGKSLTIDNPTARLNIGDKDNSTKPNVTIKNGNLHSKVYGLSGNITLTDIKFGGTIAWTGDAQGVISTKHANLLVERCDMSNVKASAAEARPRAFCSEGRSSGYLKLIDCNFPSASDGTGTFVKSKLLRTYINPLSGSAELEIANCKFGVACNIDLAQSYVWSNMNLKGCSGGFTFTISRASTSFTEEEHAFMKTIKNNNSGDVRLDWTDIKKQYIN